ncbi:helix-turn-helix domain-containing protein [Bacillaceae bacterium W0354]
MEEHLEEIGKRIYELRKHLNMTQKELCEGICTQAYISKIENGSLAIAADILFKIANRLGVDINYFYDTTEIDRIDYLREVEYQARDFVDKTDFISLQELIKKEEKTPLMNNRKFKQFILWHKALCERHINLDIKQSLQYLDEALALSDTSNRLYSEREIEILVNKANIYVDLDQNKKALEIYNHIVKMTRKIPYFSNHRVKVNLYYNLARLHLFSDNLYESIKYGKIGINICRKTQTMYGLGHLHFILGRAYEDMNKYDQALENFRKAKFIFELTENESLSTKTLYNIQDVENSMNNEAIQK